MQLVIALSFGSAETVELDSVRDRLPLEVEHGVNRRNLYPPLSPFKSLANQIGVVASDNDVLVAILNIRIGKRNLGAFALRSLDLFYRLLNILLLKLNLLLLLVNLCYLSKHTLSNWH